ncbi:MAG: ABC transporter ATP-binding protein [Alphaproteobacteria bacterium]
MSALLQVISLKAGYGRTPVLHGLDISIAEGGVSALLGANGAGKTTTLRAICGMIGSQGERTFRGQRLDRMRTDEIVRLGVGHVPENRGTFIDLDVEENLRLGAYVRGDRNGVAADLEQVFTYFPRLKERRKQRAGTLSGGEQQMLAISRALMLRPKLLLLDEPSFGLAPIVVAEIFKIMRKINVEQKVTMLLVEQNASLALDFADHAYLLETGRLVLSGPSRMLKDDTAIRRAYLGY